MQFPECASFLIPIIETLHDPLTKSSYCDTNTTINYWNPFIARSPLLITPIRLCRDQLPRNQSEDNEYTTGYQQIELCNPKIELATAPQHRLFETLPTHAPERHPFAKPPSTSSPDSQYCTLHLNSFAASTVTTRTSQPQHYANYEQSVVPEPSKVYRKSPFLPRKKEGAESNPKKESKLSTLGVYLESG